MNWAPNIPPFHDETVKGWGTPYPFVGLGLWEQTI